MLSMRRALTAAAVLGLLVALAAPASPFEPEFWKSATPEQVKEYYWSLALKNPDEARRKQAAETKNKPYHPSSDLLARLVNEKDRFGRAALHYAAALNPHPEVIALLADYGAEVNAEDLLGFTPLHYSAAFNENPEVTRKLIELGAKVNARSLEGKTPLHTAAINQKNPEVIVVLVNAGADVNAEDLKGKKPVDYARENPNLKEVLELLEPRR